MKRLYTHLSLEERAKINQMRASDLSLHKIAYLLGRDKSTISRELRRNVSPFGYFPDTANNLAKKRRRKLYSNKINKNYDLKKFVDDKLINSKWSPQMIAARVMKEFACRVSHETIYRYIYSLEGRKSALYKHLMYQRPARQVKAARRHRTKLPEQFLIKNRPEIINSRQEFGHFECDLTFFKGSNSSNLLMLIERKTRKAFVIKNPNKPSASTIMNIYRFVRSMPKGFVKSITFDNGTEFSGFGLLTTLGVKAYFCNPSSPWQKGQVERLNAILHKFIPKSTAFNNITENMIAETQNKLNNLPKKSLNHLTPNELWITTIASDFVALQT